MKFKIEEFSVEKTGCYYSKDSKFRVRFLGRRLHNPIGKI